MREGKKTKKKTRERGRMETDEEDLRECAATVCHLTRRQGEFRAPLKWESDESSRRKKKKEKKKEKAHFHLTHVPLVTRLGS